MKLDDMILVSVDDHMIEPPDMYKNHVPARWLDEVPGVARNEQGVDEWVFQGQRTSTPFGMAATVGWIPFYFDRIDRHFQNQAWLHNDFGGKLPSEVFRDHILACYITDPSGLLLRDRIGIDIIAWESDYPHTDTTWPESPEFAWKEFEDAGCTGEEIHKITWENATRFFSWDPFKHTPKEQATVGALRALARDVDTTRMVREEWKKRNEAAGIGVF
jgi:hypothetical protein